MKTDFEKLFREFLKALEYRRVDEIEFHSEEGQKAMIEMAKLHAYTTKHMVKRIKDFEEDRENMYTRKDMMEFAEYVARLYDLNGIRTWTERGESEDLNKTVNQILNEFEKDRKLKENEKLSKGDIGDILFG